MLNIGGIPPDTPVVNASYLTMTGHTPTILYVNEAHSGTLILTPNLGSYTDAARTAGALVADTTLTPSSAASGFGAALTNNDTTQVTTLSQVGLGTALSKPFAYNFTPRYMGSDRWTIKGSATFAAGDPAQVYGTNGSITANAHAEEVRQVTASFKVVGRVTRDDLANDADANEAPNNSTSEMELGTTEAYVGNHTLTQTVRFPKKPLTWQFWVQLFSAYSDATTITAATHLTEVTDNQMTYYEWTDPNAGGSYNRGPLDLKFNF
jgi:hypothetical protein